MKNFENNVIIVTGAAIGLGLAFAKELASQGAHVVLVFLRMPSHQEQF